jgi:hypothetical protein
MGKARMRSEATGEPGRGPENNRRGVVTNLPDDPEAIYQFRFGRGYVENRLEGQHHGLEMDRTRCSVGEAGRVWTRALRWPHA